LITGGKIKEKAREKRYGFLAWVLFWKLLYRHM